MNNHNAHDNSEKKTPGSFPCELFQPRSDAAPAPTFADLSEFEDWLDKELVALESRFAHNMTVDSLRSEFTKSR